MVDKKKILFISELLNKTMLVTTPARIISTLFITVLTSTKQR